MKKYKDIRWNIYYHLIRLPRYYVEVYFTKFQRFFGIRKDTSVIPEGMYCYEWDEEKEKRAPHPNGFWIKPCKYYRSMKRQLDGCCTYVGFIGFDPCLGDQCKICGQNYGDERDPLIIEREKKIEKIISKDK